MQHTDKDIDYLLSTVAVRERCGKIFEMSLAGQTNFKLNLEKLNSVSDFVLEVIRENYPSLQIPYHSRYEHLKAGGINRIQFMVDKIKAKNPNASDLDICRAKLELVLTSVLLDAGAGDSWKYLETSSGKTFSRSEGLGVASYYMFEHGSFSSDPKNPLQADAKGLQSVTRATLEKEFQVTEKNPLIGVEGRVGLLNTLGQVIEAHPNYFAHGKAGDMLDVFLKENSKKVSALKVLDFVLRIIGKIWPSRISLSDHNMGDMWLHQGLSRSLGDSASSNSAMDTKALVPFHKLSQWLTYSLLVPMIESGIEITDVEKMTGLAEYRNGGLFLDLGLIELKDKKLAQELHSPSSDLIIEWRALTVILLDKVAQEIRKSLKMSESELPLAKVLEGGTWHAGRKIAKQLRPAGGGPPLNIISDGTVF